jgi:hypothetical protein
MSLIGKLGATSAAATAIDAQSKDIESMVRDLPALATRGVNTMEAAVKAVQDHASGTIQAGGFGIGIIGNRTILHPKDRLKLANIVKTSPARIESINLVAAAMKARGAEAKAVAALGKATVLAISSSVEGATDVSELAAEQGFTIASEANAAKWKISAAAFAG